MIGEISHGDVFRFKVPRMMAVCFRKKRMDRSALEMRARQDPKRTIVGVRIRQITQNGYLRRRSVVADWMIPAPPTLMPPQSRAARFLDAHISRNPFQILGPRYLRYGLHSSLRSEKQSNDGIVPSQRHKRIVRACARDVSR